MKRYLLKFGFIYLSATCQNLENILIETNAPYDFFEKILYKIGLIEKDVGQYGEGEEFAINIDELNDFLELSEQESITKEIIKNYPEYNFVLRDNNIILDDNSEYIKLTELILRRKNPEFFFKEIPFECEILVRAGFSNDVS